MFKKNEHDATAGTGPTVDKMTVEQWAEKQGMLPQTFVTKAKVGKRDAVGRRPNPEYAKFAAAKAHNAWPVGREMTEDEFNKAVAAAQAVQLR